MNEVLGEANSSEIGEMIYFAPLLPWQQDLWSQLTKRVSTPPHNLPHALLAAGMQGMGKRAFIWRFVAWLLCRQRDNSPHGACASCESCQWLKSSTHPSLQVLPLISMPEHPTQTENHSKTKPLSSSKKSDKSTNVKSAHKGTSSSAFKIKVDDIRDMQPFIYQGGQGMRICVLDHAEKMTIAAANALLKTLEEPQAQVHLFLISDSPAQLLPTIKSRVQQLALQQIESASARHYISQTLGDRAADTAEVEQLLRLANGAPLAAVALARAPWYSKRPLWLTTWQALRSGKRSSVAASDYWQGQLSVAEFIELSELMLLDIQRVCLGLTASQRDINLAAALQSYPPSEDGLVSLSASLQEMKTALNQNVQEKFAFDKLMQDLAFL